ncbi:hypothetical protein ACFVYP_24630 [Kitasatospora sp. NPDC058201]|uniref:hypothetical protein n=1 Tax=unclassified Kitasatospora TaxID=2633591 RepID=UPI003666BB0D
MTGQFRFPFPDDLLDLLDHLDPPGLRDRPGPGRRARAGAAARRAVRLRAAGPARRRPGPGGPAAGGVPAGPPGGRPPGGGASGPGSAGPAGPGTGDRRRWRPRGAPPPQPVALALVVRAADFADLSRHGLFGDLPFRAYLRRAAVQLRALYGQGLEVHLRVFDPADFEDYCEALGFDPADAAARVAYAADPELAGEPFVYAGQRLVALLPELADDHRARVRISVAMAALLSAVGEGPPAERRSAAVTRYAVGVLLALAGGAGEGVHLVTIRCHGPEDGEELSSAADVRVERGRLRAGGRDTEAFCVTLAAGVAGGGAGAMVLHGDPAAPGGQTVRGWALDGGRLRPMTVREVLDSLADDVGRGMPFPPAAVPLPGFPLPQAPPEGPDSSADPPPGGPGAPGGRPTGARPGEDGGPSG